MEILDICDERGLPTGETIERAEAHRRGILHRTAHVWVVRRREGRWEILLQKRAQNKESFPGMFDTSSGGHIPTGAEPLDSALRELEEELGIRARPEQLAYAGHFRSQYEVVFYGAPFRDNEYTRVYVYREPVEISGLRLQTEEVEEVRWFDLEAVREEIRTSRERICVPGDGLAVLTDYLNREA